MEQLSLLVVDDESGIRSGINRALKDFKVSFPFIDDDFSFLISEAETGEEAIGKINNEKIDIVLLDNKLPGIEGIEVLEYINKNSVDCAVMMITSYASIDLAVRATNNGAFNFIPKPFSAQDLKSAVESITKYLFLKRMTRKMKNEAKEVRFKFLSVLSHELKSPINAVEGYLRIMKENCSSYDKEVFEKMIDRSLIRLESMRSLIIDLLDFTKIESGTKVRNITEVDIMEIAKLAVDSVYPMAIQLNIEIITDFPEQLSVKADANEIEIIFNNLLSNAVKYNKQNGKVIFRISADSNGLKIEVRDTGIGISPDEQKVLFNEFTRIKTDKTISISGSGLGLTITQKVVDLYHGTITMESVPDEGSCFTVELPVYQPE